MIEQLILSHLIHNENFGRKTLPFLKDDYFENKTFKITFQLISNFVRKYNKFPNKEALFVDLNALTNVPETEHEQVESLISALQIDKQTNEQWLLDQTEKFCQDKALYNAIIKSIQIIDKKNEQISKGSIPTILSEALAVSFDNHIGHDFLQDFIDRYNFYHHKEEKIEFDLHYFNLITKGGLPNKTLNIILAGTGVGKSLAMCHFAAANLAKGKNVLYITLEMAEERIAERIDANLLNVSMDELSILPRDVYEKKLNRVKEKTKGKLIIKEYPTASAGVGHFRHLLNELRLKRDFEPDIIYVDYLNLCVSMRIKSGSSVNSYSYIKAIAEELRGLAVEFDVPIVSATQTTRGGFTSTDLGLEDTSESFGLPATADLMIALISTEELQAINQYMVKQLKNRYNDITVNRRFMIGVDRSKMKLYDVEQTAQQNLIEKPEFIDKETGEITNKKRGFDFGDFK